MASAAYAAPRLVSERIDERQAVVLRGNTRAEARPANDRGAVANTMRLDHMQLLLNRLEESELALDQAIEQIQDPASPNFHRWLTSAEIGAKYGPAEADVEAVTTWLTGHGFTVHGVQPSRMLIDFSGTAGEVHSAFGTEIHHLTVNGEAHIANMSDPTVPTALARVVNGIVSLNDFKPIANFKRRGAYTAAQSGSTYYAVTPADLATIYNLTPLFQAGVTGQGQTVTVIEDTNVYSTADWTSFRNAFGLSGYTGASLTQVHPTGSSACSNPGVVAGDEGEATLDVEWASAAAPSAAIVLASCSGGRTTFGGLTALYNLVNGANPPAIVSVSYGECEAQSGATLNKSFYTTYQQAAAVGTSVYVSSGDQAATGCDRGASYATHGIAVNGWGSTPYDVSVGGTDFSDTYSGTNASYWGSTNGGTYGSAKSYIPEIPWNDSCGSAAIAQYLGYSVSYGSGGFCNSSRGSSFLNTDGGSGGPSACATGAPSTAGVVSGTCQGYAKPSWQSVVGNPSDGKRDLPDVSLFSADGVWSHFYIYCDSDVNDQGATCTGAPINWSKAGGTSFASPIMAGFQALVNQKYGKQGNPNPVLYALARNQYGTSGAPGCNSSSGASVGGSCIFYDVTQGDIDVPCRGSVNCYLPSGRYGVLATNNAVAYAAGTGWDFATGIGTVNAANLVNNWQSGVKAAASR